MNYLTEMVDHHIDDFYAEYPGEKNKNNPLKTRHNSHKSIHDWLTTERRPGTTEHRPKTIQHRPKSIEEALRDEFKTNYNDELYDNQKRGSREQYDSDTEFNLHKKNKTKKTTTETFNKYYVVLPKSDRQHFHQLSDSEYDLENNRFSKIKTTTESTYKYYTDNQNHENDNFNFYKTTDGTTPDYQNKYFTNSKIYENDDLNFHKNINATDKTTSQTTYKYYAKHKKIEDVDFDTHKFTLESPHKYYPNNKNIQDDDEFSVHKNARATDKTSFEFSNKYRENEGNHENDDYNFQKNTKTTHKTTSQFPNKYYENIKKYEDNDFKFHSSIKTKINNDKTTDKTTSESRNKYHVNKQNRENDDISSYRNIRTNVKSTSESPNKYRAINKKIEDDDFNYHRNAKTTPKKTFKSPNKYQSNNKQIEDEDFNIHENTKKNTHITTFKSPNKYHSNNKKNNDEDFIFYENTKTTHTTTVESPNKYHAYNKNNRDDDFNFHKSVQVTHESTSESANKYYANQQNHENDNFNFHENNRTTHKTTSEYPTIKIRVGHLNFTTDTTTFETPNKYHGNKKKIYEHNDLDFHKNTKAAEKTITESPNIYRTNKNNYNDKYFRKSSKYEDKFDNTKYTTNTEIRAVPVNEYYTKKHERAEKHSQKLYNFEKNAGNDGIYSTETRATIEPTKGYHSKDHKITNLYKLLNINNKLTTTENAEDKITAPLKGHYSTQDSTYRNYNQEASNSDTDMTKSPKFTKTTDIKTTAKSQPAQTGRFVLRALTLNEYNPIKYKHNDKVLKSSTSKDGLRILLSQATDIGSTKKSTAENFELGNILFKNDIEPHRIQTEDKFGTKWTWPTFEDMLEEIGKKYDWRKDRWIELKRHANKKMTKADFVNNFQEKHKFSYSTIKLNSTKSRRNVVIAVTAVR